MELDGGPDASHGVDGQLRVELEPFGRFGPEFLQGLHPIVETLGGDSGGRVEGEFDVRKAYDPVVEQVGARCLPVPPRTKVWQGEERTATARLDPVVISQLPEGRWHDFVHRRIDGQVDDVLCQAISATSSHVNVPDLCVWVRLV